MKSPHLTKSPVCTCGSREFTVASRTRSAAGRLEHHVCCKLCGTLREVDKSTYALYRYLEEHRPSPDFLRLFDLR